MILLLLLGNVETGFNSFSLRIYTEIEIIIKNSLIHYWPKEQEIWNNKNILYNLVWKINDFK